MELSREALRLREEKNSVPEQQGIIAFPARVIPRTLSDEAAMRLTLAQTAIDATVFEDLKPFFWAAMISSDELDSWYTRMAPSSLKNYAADAQSGIAFQDSHDSWRLPLGRSLTGRFDQKGEGGSVFADFFTIHGLKFNDATYATTDDYINAMRAGIVKDVSIGFMGGEYICSVCSCDMMDWDSDCRHWPGDEVELKDKDGNVLGTEVVFAWVANARLREVSAVYHGATPGAAILKAERAAAGGRLTPEHARLLEQRYRIKLPDARHFVAVGNPQKERSVMDKKETDPTNAATQPPATDTAAAERATVAETTLTEIRAIIKSVHPEFADDQPVSAILRTMVEEHKELRSKVTELTAEVAKVAEIRSLADDGRAYRKDLIEEAMAEGVRAHGDDFKQEHYRGLLDKSSIETIKTMRDDWKRTASVKFPGGRQTVEGEENKTLPVASTTPASAYKDV